MRAFALLVLLMFVGSVQAAAAGSNCRLIIQVHYKNGKKKVIVEETGAMSHAECRTTAQQRELDSEDEDIQRVKVVFGYREPSVLSVEEE